MGGAPVVSGADRGRDTSEELTEIRTVLSRAEDARRTLWRYQQEEISRAGHWDFAQDPPVYVTDSTDPDPDIDDMIRALDTAILALDRWRRTSRPKKGRKES